MNTTEIDTIGRLIKEIKKFPVDGYEILTKKTQIYENSYRKNQLESKRNGISDSFILRILVQKGNKSGIGVVTGKDKGTTELRQDIKHCYKLATLNTVPKYYFPEKKKYSTIRVVEAEILNNPIETTDDISRNTFEALKQFNNVKPTFGRIGTFIQERKLENSSDVQLSSIKTFIHLEFAIKAEKNGKLAEYWDNLYIKDISLLNLQSRFEHWSKVATDSLNSISPQKSENAIVLFSPNVLRTAFNPVLSYHISGKAHYEKLSALAIGEKVADKDFTLYDDGLLQGGLRSNTWDGEGNPQSTTKVVENGIFTKRIYDQKHGLIENSESTGNGFRSDDGAVTNTVSNLCVNSGSKLLDDIISSIQKGFYIDKFSWLRPEELSGSFGAEIRNGYHIKNGELVDPIKGGNVSGNVLEMIKNILYISKEREFSRNAYLPYICFNNLAISS